MALKMVGVGWGGGVQRQKYNSIGGNGYSITNIQDSHDEGDEYGDGE